jgi:hypothetical protein
MKKLGIVTVVTRNYLAGARALANSIERVVPEASFFICLIDRPPAEWSESGESAVYFFADSLGIPNWKRFAFQYQPLELACALKPHAIRHVLDQGFEKVLYVDADQLFYSSPAAIMAGLAHDSILLTPHLNQPSPDNRPWKRELTILRAGIYNGGFVAVRKSDTTDRFLKWWGDRLNTECIIDLHGSYFVDQRWLGLVPGLFPNVRIERSPGINAAYWTLWSHSLEHSGDGYRVGTDPLVCFHFSGFDPQLPTELSRYDDRDLGPQDTACQELLAGYAAELLRMGWAECRSWGCEFDQLHDGTAISPYWREAIRLSDSSLSHIEDPFDTGAYPDLVARLSALEFRVHRNRTDWRLTSPVKLSRWQRILQRFRWMWWQKGGNKDGG